MSGNEEGLFGHQAVSSQQSCGVTLLRKGVAIENNDIYIDMCRLMGQWMLGFPQKIPSVFKCGLLTFAFEKVHSLTGFNVHQFIYA